MGYIVPFVSKSVRRRLPKYISIIIAIGLGVSLFVSVDIAVNSLTEGMIYSSSQSFGEFDISISNNTGKVHDDVLFFVRNNFAKDITAIVGRNSFSATIFANRSGQLEKGISIIGFNTTDRAGEQKLPSFRNLEGKKINSSEIKGKNLVIVPKPLAEKLELKKNDVIETNFPRIFQNGSTVYVHVVLRVYDIVKFEGKATEQQGDALWISRETYLSIYDPDGIYQHYYDVLWVSLSSNHNEKPVSKDRAEKISNKIKEALIKYLNDDPKNPSLTVMAIRAEVEQSIREGLSSFKVFLNMLATLIIIAGILLISNIQMMSVEEREVQIGILRSLGAKKGEIVRLFLLESVFLGVLGSVIGFFIGMGLGKYMANYINEIFRIGGSPIFVVNTGTIILAVVSGVLIAIFTGIYPALKARSINIVEVLRGIKSYKDEKLSKKGFYFGWLSLFVSFYFYYKLENISTGSILSKSGWDTINEQFYSLLFLSALMLGLGLILSQYTTRYFAFNVISIGYIGVSIWWFRNGVPLLAEGGNVDKIFYVALLMLISGTIVLVGVNLDILGAILRKLMAVSHATRAIGVVSTRSMTSKKIRAILTFSIFAIILSLNVFAATWGSSVEKGSVDVWSFYSGNIDVVVELDVPVNPTVYNYTSMLYSIDSHITDVASVRHATGYAKTTSPMYNTPFIPIDMYAWKNDTMINKQGNYRFDIIVDPIVDKYKLDTSIDLLSKSEQLNISRHMWEMFFSNDNFTKKGDVSPDGLPPVILTGSRVIADENHTVTFMSKIGPLKFRAIGSVVNYGPSAAAFFPIAFIPARYAVFFEGFDYVPYPNYFYVMTSYGLTDPHLNDIAHEIEKRSNGEESDLRKMGYFVGALATPLWQYFQNFAKIYVQFLDFLQVFLSTGLIIGVVGLMVISLRNVAERRREIGMQRAIGFSRKQVVLSAIFEIFILGFIGLLIGIINGLIIADSFTKLSSIDLVIPWSAIFLYFVITFLSAFLAGLVPGIKVAKIPPSEALRYIG